MKPRQPGNTSWSGNRRSFPKAVRKKIMDRDGWRCQLRGARCTGIATEADHRVPHAEGGDDTAENGAAVCANCHAEKTRSEQQRGIARRSRYRPKAQHPGLT